MTQEEKHLLLVDLSARLPYNTICEFTDTEDDFCMATAALGYSLRDFIAGKTLIKPYLRPMSSMTEKEMFDFHENGGTLTYYFKYDIDLYSLTVSAIDWLNSHHFDYRGLIPMGLALAAPDDMYK